MEREEKLEKKRSYWASYWAMNKEELKKKQREYYKNNPDKKLEYYRAYREKNKEKLKQYHKDYYLKKMFKRGE